MQRLHKDMWRWSFLDLQEQLISSYNQNIHIRNSEYLYLSSIWSVNMPVVFTWNFPKVYLNNLATEKCTTRVITIRSEDHGPWSCPWSLLVPFIFSSSPTCTLVQFHGLNHGPLWRSRSMKLAMNFHMEHHHSLLLSHFSTGARFCLQNQQRHQIIQKHTSF